MAIGYGGLALYQSLHRITLYDATISKRLSYARQFLDAHVHSDGSIVYDYDTSTHKESTATGTPVLVRDVGIVFAEMMLASSSTIRVQEQITLPYVTYFFATPHADKPTGMLAIAYVGFSILGLHDSAWTQAHNVELETLLHEILARQNKTGVFVESATDARISGYYTGESLLALSYALQSSPANEQLKIKDAIMRTYAAVDAGAIDYSTTRSLYMWLNRATVLNTASSMFSPSEKALMMDVVNMVHGEVMDQILPLRAQKNTCIWGEGLAQYLLIDPHSDRAPILRLQLQEIVRDNLVLQNISDNSLGNAHVHSINDGGFPPQAGAPTARIDFAQHCVGMLTTYQTLLTR
jgi:hypothetical protein